MTRQKILTMGIIFLVLAVASLFIFSILENRNLKNDEYKENEFLGKTEEFIFMLFLFFASAFCICIFVEFPYIWDTVCNWFKNFFNA